MRLRPSQILGGTLLAVVVASASFVGGWHLARRPVGSGQPEHLTLSGDAQAQVRNEVLVPLRTFQAGYSKRDPSSIGTFMEQLFPKDQVSVVLGTDRGESIDGYQQVGEFIANDWRHWGDVQLQVDDAVVWAADDVAWLVTVGTVGEGTAKRGIRFSAVLTRTGGRWLFRYIQFEWDDTPEKLSGLLRRSIFGKPAGFGEPAKP
jgi:hypothetical protein